MEEEQEYDEKEEEEVEAPPTRINKEPLVKAQKVKKEVSPSHPIQLDNPDIEKAIRSVLNKVSEGNIEPMFQSLLAVVKQYTNPKQSQSVAVFAHCYAKIFI